MNRFMCVCEYNFVIILMWFSMICNVSRLKRIKQSVVCLNSLWNATLYFSEQRLIKLHGVDLEKSQNSLKLCMICEDLRHPWSVGLSPGRGV